MNVNIFEQKPLAESLSAEHQDLKQRQYQIKQIDSSKLGFCASQISNNEQYLAYGGYQQILKIYDIKKDRIIKEVKMNHFIKVCQFTSDSQQLYVGCYDGYVYGIDIKKDFKIIFQLQVHRMDIFNLIVVQNRFLITASQHRCITKIDIKQKKIVFIFKRQNYYYCAFDYSQRTDMIITGYQDISIIFIYCGNRSVIIYNEKSHEKGIKQLQFTNNGQNFISLDSNSNIFKWRIDLKKSDIKKIQEFENINKIITFYQINQNQNLLLICDKHFIILNDQGEIIYKLEHQAIFSMISQIIFFIQNIDDEINTRAIRQLDNARYIQIRSFSNHHNKFRQNCTGCCVKLKN